MKRFASVRENGAKTRSRHVFVNGRDKLGSIMERALQPVGKES